MDEKSPENKIEQTGEEIHYWKGQAQLFRLIANVILLIVLTISWWMVVTMAQAEALRYDTGDLAYPFISAAGILLLVNIIVGFTRSLKDIYFEELEIWDQKLQK